MVHKNETAQPPKLIWPQLARQAPIFLKTSPFPLSQQIGRELPSLWAWPDDAADVLRLKAERCQMVYCGKLRQSSAENSL